MKLFCGEDIGVVGLTTVYNFDFDVRVVGFDAFGGLFGLLGSDIFAVVEGDKFVVVDMHTLKGVMNDLFYVLAGYREIAVDEADVVAFAHTDATNMDGADCGSDLGCLHMVGGFGHGWAIGGEVGLKVKADEGGDTLWHGVGGDDVDFLIREVDDLTCAEDDVAVVW